MNPHLAADFRCQPATDGWLTLALRAPNWRVSGPVPARNLDQCFALGVQAPKLSITDSCNLPVPISLP